MTWNERLGEDWDAPLDAETTDKMMARADADRLEDDLREEREQKIWELYAHYLAADGTLYGRPSS